MCPPPALSSNTTAEIKKAPLPSRRRKDGLIRFAKDNTSQGGEDGILRAIYDCLGDGPRTLVDVGAWDGVHLSNTHSLLVPDASTWRGFLIEADASKCEKLRALHEPLGNVCVEAFVSCEDDARKLPAILGKHSCPWSVDLLSIDVDGVDYWLWRDFLESGRAAKVVVIEFNPSMPDDLHYVPPRADAQRHGASLAALCALGEAYDYSLVETTLFNAVFADAATRAVLVERGLVPADASRYDLHETTMGTQLYQLYDGTLKVHGTKKLLWHRRPIDERKIQVLGEAERLFPFAPGGTSTEKKPRRPKRRRRRRSPETKPRAAPYAAYALAALFVASLVVHRRR